MISVPQRRPPGRGQSGFPQGRAVAAAVLLHGAAAILLLCAGERRPGPDPELPAVVVEFVALPPTAPADPAPAGEPDPAAPPPPATPLPEAAQAPPVPSELPKPEPAPPASPQPAPAPPTPPGPVPEPSATHPAPPIQPRYRSPSPSLARAKPSRSPARPAARNVPEPGPLPAAASAPPAPAVPQAPVAPAPAVSPGWQGLVSAWLQQHKTYPEAARVQGVQGVVGVRFTVGRDGRVLNVAVVRPSGSDVLNAAATALLRDARMPSFPDAMTQASVTITVAIRYMFDH